MPKITIQDADNFREAVATLRKYRRAEVLDENETNIIDDLYVDLFPDGRLLKEFQRGNTAFLIGRRGTGKSTIFQKAQSELKKDSRTISVYVDVAPVYQAAKSGYVPRVDPSSTDFQDKMLWSSAFLRQFVNELISSISEKAGKSLFEQLFFASPKRRQADAVKEVREALEREEYLVEQDISPLGSTTTSTKSKNSKSHWASLGAKIKPSLSSVGGKIGRKQNEEVEESRSGNQQVIRTFDFSKFIASLKKALKGLEVRQILLFLDDYSELPRDAQQLLMDHVIFPLETASHEYFKIKIAAYPDRYYLGKLDPQKIDFHHLDISTAYNSFDEPQVERRSSEYVQRLLEKRVKKFCGKPVDDYFEGGPKDVFKLLYQASNCNPRALGYILDNCAISHLSEGRAITEAAIRDASQRYYEEKIETQLRSARFSSLTEEERVQIAASKNLLDAIVSRSKQLKNNSGGRTLAQFSESKLPTSHFHVTEDCDDLLMHLSHLQIINFYKSLINKDGKKTSVYSLNYGLCQKENIIFGRPNTARNSGKYFIERCFNFSDIVKDAHNDVEVFYCSKCEHEFGVEHEDTFAVYGFSCPNCKVQKLEKRQMLSGGELHEIVDQESLLEPIEMSILQSMYYSHKQANIRAKDISEEVDLPPRIVGLVVKRLAEKDLVDRKGTKTNRTYRLTQKARQKFFSQ